MNEQRITWEEYGLTLAKTASIRSQDPFIKVGACALRHDKGIAALGYNGAPSGIEIDWSNRDERRKRVIHAEANCLNRVLPNEVWLLAVTHLCCSECIKIVAIKNIKFIVYELELENYDNNLVKQLAKEFNITLTQLPIPVISV